MSSVLENMTNMRLVAENDELTVRISALASLTESSAGSAAEYLRVYRELLGRVEQEAVSESHTGIYELCQYYKQAIDSLVARGGFSEDNIRLLLSRWPGLVLAYLASPDAREARKALIDHIRHPDLALPISDGDAAILDMMLDESSPIPAEAGDTNQAGDDAIEMSPEDLEIIIDEPAGSPAAQPADDGFEIIIEDAVDPGPSADKETRVPEGEIVLPERELVSTLLNQLKVMQEPQGKLLEALSSDPRSREDIVAAVEVLCGYLQRFSEASGEIGLPGLQYVGQRAVNNMSAWSKADAMPETSAAGLVNRLFDSIKKYLLAPYSMAKAKNLVETLCDSEWSDPVMPDEVQSVVNLFLNASSEEPVVEPEPEETQQEQGSKRPKLATAEDVSLAVPDDVDDELFEIMLEELPEQTEQFSGAVQNLIAGGTQEDVKVAQRMAHSLKGAGNTIGIKGVANLTHHLEDILIQFSEQGALPTQALSMTMMNVVDCLEAMGESLNGNSEPPQEAQAVLQEVLDWANRIDQEGLPTEDDSMDRVTPSVGMEALPDSQSADSLSVSTEISGFSDSLSTGLLSGNSAMNALSDSMVSDTLSQSGAMRALSDSISGMQALAAGQQVQKRRAKAKETSSSTVRVPASLVDNLLRLAGEATIMTGLMRERVRQTVGHIQNLQNEFHRMHTLGAELERLVDIKDFSNTQQQGNDYSEFDALEMDQYSELHTYSRMLAETATDSQQLGYQVKQELMGLEDMLVDQDLLNKESQGAVMDVRMVPAKTIVSKLQRSVRQTSRLTNKQVKLQVKGDDTQMDGDVLSELADPLMHILRNAIDHGIEAPDKRIQLGKPAEGAIELGFFREGNNILIRCRDDGAGINYDAIQRKAESLGILEPGKKATEDELKRILLLSNFSTRDEVTQTSGRGVGMDAVYAKIIEIGGSLALESEAGAGTLFELRVPLTLVTSHALLVRQGPSLLAISDRGVLQILHGQDGVLEEEGDKVFYRVGDNRYPARFLESIMELPPDRRASDRTRRPVFLVQDEMGVSAVIVGEVLESLNIVIKDFGKYVPNPAGVTGAAILGDGSVKPVIDLPELLHHARLAHMPMVMVPEKTEAPKPDRAMVMVVDDSRSARYVLSKAVERAGYIVRPAHDGLEALKLLESRPADLVLSDMEMPRMNGIELTEHMRMSGQLSEIPVIMVTSRSTKKHREEAESAGVNDYFTKPFDEEELVKAVEKLLQEAGVSP